LIDVNIYLYGYLKVTGSSDKLKISISKHNNTVRNLVEQVFKNISSIQIDSWVLSEDRRLRSRLIPIKDGKVLSLKDELKNEDVIKLLPPCVGG